MSIQVSCPNGHALRVKDSFAGKTGYCPHCHAKVHVPVPSRFSEDDVLGILGPPPDLPPPDEPESADDDHQYVHQEPQHARRAPEEESGISLVGSSIHQRPKVCPECHMHTSFSFSICPRCGTPLPEPQLSQEAILQLLQTPSSRPPHAHDGLAGVDATPMKGCLKCKRDIMVHTHICPHCHTYVGGIFARKKSAP